MRRRGVQMRPPRHQQQRGAPAPRLPRYSHASVGTRGAARRGAARMLERLRGRAVRGVRGAPWRSSSRRDARLRSICGGGRASRRGRRRGDVKQGMYVPYTAPQRLHGQSHAPASPAAPACTTPSSQADQSRCPAARGGRPACPQLAGGSLPPVRAHHDAVAGVVVAKEVDPALRQEAVIIRQAQLV
jgi:hypothetical protein